MAFKLKGPRGKLGPSAAIEKILGPTAPEEEGGNNVVKKGGKGRTTTLTDKKGRETTFSVDKRKILKGTAIVNKETGVKESSAMELGPKPILGSETEYNLPGSGSEKTTVDLKLKVPHTVSFTNKKGKTKSARSGTKEADKLRKKFLKKKDKVQKGYKGQEATETGKVITYKKGTVEYS